MNTTRRLLRSCRRAASLARIIISWVLTQHSTVARCRSMAAQVAAASNRSMRTVVLPSWIGVVCEVQIPKPNGWG